MPIEKRDGAYRARVRRRGKPSASETFPTLAQARAWLDRREGELADARAGILPRHTVRDAVREYQARECPKHEGERWERIRLDKFLRTAAFVDRQLQAITPDDISKWRDGMLADGLATGSARREYGLVRSVFRTAMREWGWLRSTPFAAVSPPAPGAPRKQRVSDEQAAAIAAALGWYGAAPETASQFVAAAFLMGLETALRQGELLRGTREHCNALRRVWHVPKSKNGDTRDVPLSKRALAILALLPDRGYLFPIGAGTCDTLFRRARDAAGCPQIHFHDARREATTRLAKKVDVLTLAKITGHRDINLLNRVYYAPDMGAVAALLD